MAFLLKVIIKTSIFVRQYGVKINKINSCFISSIGLCSLKLKCKGLHKNIVENAHSGLS